MQYVSLDHPDCPEPVEVTDLAVLAAELESAYTALAGWVARLSTTDGPDARFMTDQLDSVVGATRGAMGAVTTIRQLHAASASAG